MVSPVRFYFVVLKIFGNFSEFLHQTDIINYHPWSIIWKFYCSVIKSSVWLLLFVWIYFCHLAKVHKLSAVEPVKYDTFIIRHLYYTTVTNRVHTKTDLYYTIRCSKFRGIVYDRFYCTLLTKQFLVNFLTFCFARVNHVAYCLPHSVIVNVSGPSGFGSNTSGYVPSIAGSAQTNKTSKYITHA